MSLRKAAMKCLFQFSFVNLSVTCLCECNPILEQFQKMVF